MLVDKDGYRSNIGIILINSEKNLFWGRRVGRDSWQFPQGGMQKGEDPIQTLFRELYEEIGLDSKSIKIIAHTKNWLRYKVPKPRKNNEGLLCVGQKQLWYLVEMKSSESKINFHTTVKPEFDYYTWVSYWYPIRHVVGFKRQVYKKALMALASWGLSVDYNQEAPFSSSMNFILD